MNQFTYWSPLVFGTLLFALFASANLQDGPAWLIASSRGAQAAWISVGALLAGLHAQIVMFGCQGFFAQCLPVPIGKTIRGSGASAAGLLMLLYFVGALAWTLVGPVLEGLLFVVATGVPIALAAAAMTAYLWSLPTAVRDFGRE